MDIHERDALNRSGDRLRQAQLLIDLLVKLGLPQQEREITLRLALAANEAMSFSSGQVRAMRCASATLSEDQK